MRPRDVHDAVEAIAQGVGQLVDREVVRRYDLEALGGRDGLEIRERQPAGFDTFENRMKDQRPSWEA